VAEFGEGGPRELSADGGVIAPGDKEAGFVEQRFDVQARAFSGNAEVEIYFRGGEVTERDEGVNADDSQVSARQLAAWPEPAAE